MVRLSSKVNMIADGLVIQKNQAINSHDIDLVLLNHSGFFKYRQVSNISRTKSHNSNVSRLVLQLLSRNLLKPCVKSRMKI